jgi:hypothetical protein
MTDSPLGGFVVPVALIKAERVRLRPCELVFGFRNGWLDAKSVVDVATDQLADGKGVSEPVEELASLFSTEYYRVPELIAGFKCSDAISQPPEEVWQFLAVATVVSRSKRIEDAYEPLAMVAADFGHPGALDSIVYYQPFKPRYPGVAPGPEYVKRCIEDYLHERRAVYASRDRCL